MEMHHIGVSVTNLERSIEFYRDMLEMELAVPIFDLGGVEVERVMGLQDVKVRQCYMVKGDVRLELFEFASPASAEQDPNYSVANRGISHFGFIVPDIDSVYQRMNEGGVRIHSPIQTFPSGIKAIYARDPDGNVFEVMQMNKDRARH